MNKTLLMCVMVVTGVSYGASPDDRQTKKPLSLFESVVVGSAAGATEVALTGQPLSYRANMMSLKLPRSSNPVHWYGGFTATLGGMAPITAVQKVVRVEGERLLSKGGTRELSNFQKLLVACGAGAVSAVVATPSEAVPVYVQLQKVQHVSKTPTQAFKDLKGAAWRGLSVTAVRDAFFTMGYGALAPLAQARTQEVVGDNPVTSVASGAAVGGVVAAVTQPFAVLRTLLHGDPFKKVYANPVDAAKKLYQQDGARGFFRGMSARGPRIMVAVPLLNKAEELYTQLLTPRE